MLGIPIPPTVSPGSFRARYFRGPRPIPRCPMLRISRQHSRASLDRENGEPAPPARSSQCRSSHSQVWEVTPIAGGNDNTIGSGFDEATGLAIDGEGNVYIADTTPWPGRWTTSAPSPGSVRRTRPRSLPQVGRPPGWRLERATHSAEPSALGFN